MDPNTHLIVAWDELLWLKHQRWPQLRSRLPSQGPSRCRRREVLPLRNDSKCLGVDKPRPPPSMPPASPEADPRAGGGPILIEIPLKGFRLRHGAGGRLPDPRFSPPAPQPHKIKGRGARRAGAHARARRVKPRKAGARGPIQTLECPESRALTSLNVGEDVRQQKLSFVAARMQSGAATMEEFGSFL